MNDVLAVAFYICWVGFLISFAWPVLYPLLISPILSVWRKSFPQLHYTNIYRDDRLCQKPANPGPHREAYNYDRAKALVKATKKTMTHAPLSSEQQAMIRKQTKESLKNIAQVLWRLHRLRKVAGLVLAVGFDTSRFTIIEVGKYAEETMRQSSELTELEEMERRLLSQMEHALKLLESISVSLMKVEFAQDNRVDQIITELAELNKRMGELAESYDELNRHA